MNCIVRSVLCNIYIYIVYCLLYIVYCVLCAVYYILRIICILGAVYLVVCTVYWYRILGTVYLVLCTAKVWCTSPSPYEGYDFVHSPPKVRPRVWVHSRLKYLHSASTTD